MHPKVPKPVKQAHHLLCAFGALLFILAGTVIESVPEETVSLQYATGISAGAIGWLFVFPARGLVRHKISPTRYAQVYRDWLRALPASAFSSCLAISSSAFIPGDRVLVSVARFSNGIQLPA